MRLRPRIESTGRTAADEVELDIELDLDGRALTAGDARAAASSCHFPKRLCERIN